MKKLIILFWKTYAKFWDLRPRIFLPKYHDYPIACTPINDEGKYEYPKDIKILYEWDEKGHHWIAFSRKPSYFNYLASN